MIQCRNCGELFMPDDENDHFCCEECLNNAEEYDGSDDE